MYYYQDTMEKDLTEQGYVKIERKPWNVKVGDIFILVDRSRPPFMLDQYIPVIITIVDHYPEFARNTNPWGNLDEYARTAYRFYHKPHNPEDIQHLYNWYKTEGWNRFDTVEVWRKK